MGDSSLPRNVGQTLHSFGLQTMLCEDWFPRDFSRLIRHAAARDCDVADHVGAFPFMFGAGMIKVPAHSCWRDLSAFFITMRTQPLPIR